MMLPPLPGLREAPITAMDAGLKNGATVTGSGRFWEDLEWLPSNRTRASTAMAPSL